MKTGTMAMVAGLLFACVCGGAVAQSEPSATATESAAPAMETLEEIYRDQLKSRHIPLLGRYLTELQRLAAEAADQRPYEEEMARVQGWISNGGLVDLRLAKRFLDAKDGKVPMPEPEPPPPLPTGRNWIVLTPDLAEMTVPEVEITSASSGISVHEVAWRIEFLPAGMYEVVLRYTSATGSDLETPVRVEFAGQRLDEELPPVKRREPGREYRLANLGRLSVPVTASGELLKMKVLGGDDGEVVVYEVVVAPLNPMLRSRPGD